MLDLPGFTRMFASNLHRGPRDRADQPSIVPGTWLVPRQVMYGTISTLMVYVYPQKRHPGHLRDKGFDLRRTPSGRTRIGAGVYAARHNRSACMSTVPPGRIKGDRAGNAKAPGPAVLW